MNMKLKTLFAAAFAVVGFCSTASAVTYPLPTDGSRLVGQNQVITIPEGLCIAQTARFWITGSTYFVQMVLWKNP